MTTDRSLEIIAFNIESCITIQRLGANRIELCDNPGEGGTTPSYGLIHAAREKVSIELYPIIRPRGGDFFYNEYEFEIMKSDIRICKNAGCDGVVIGILNAEGSIDKKRSGQLVELAYPMGVTFHRAFDRVCDGSKALEDVIDIGCERILTSGFFPSAIEGADNIAALLKQAGERIIIMPGSGVRATNIAELKTRTGANEFHSSARKLVPGNMNFKNPAMTEKLMYVSVDETEVQQLLQALQ